MVFAGLIQCASALCSHAVSMLWYFAQPFASPVQSWTTLSKYEHADRPTPTVESFISSRNRLLAADVFGLVDASLDLSHSEGALDVFPGRANRGSSFTEVS